MKATATNKTRTVNSHEFKGSKFKLDNESSQLFEILRSKIYQDKILAVIREYSCNALDAHVEAGVDKPITISLPSALNPHFKVRDYGNGLNEEGMLEIYATYGVSTKRDTNSQIGQLGLGCKSGFAYGNSFLVTSYHKGNKSIYNCSIDETDIGQMSKLSSEPSDEPSGIEISLVVKNNDYNEFITKSRNFFQHWVDKRPEIQGIDESEFWDGSDIKNEVVKGDGYVYYEDQHYPVAVMGNVPYKLELHAFTGEDNFYNRNDSNAYYILDANPTLHFEIGDLAVTASREGLEYNDLTKRSIRAKVKQIQSTLAKLLSKKFEDCKSMWDAKLLFNQTFSNDYSSFSRIIKNCRINYKGKPISSGHYDVADIPRDVLKVFHFHKNHRGKRVKSEDTKKIVVKSNALLIYDDVKQHQGRLNRIAPIFEDFDTKKDVKGITDAGYEDVYLVRGEGKAGQKAIKEKKLDMPKAIKLSSLPKYVLRDIYPSNATVKGGMSGVKNKKHGKKVFVYDNSEGNSRHHYTKSDFFKAATLDFSTKDQIVFNYVDKFEVPDIEQGVRDETCCYKHPMDFQSSRDLLKSLGVKVPTVYFVKKAHWDLAATKTNWISFREFYKNKIDEILSDGERVNQLYNSAKVYSHLQSINSTVRELLLDLNSKNVIIDESPTIKWNDAIKKMKILENEKVSAFIETVQPLYKDYDYNAKSQYHYRYGYGRNNVFAQFIEFIEKLAEDKDFEVKGFFDLDYLHEQVLNRYPIIECCNHSAKEHFYNVVNVIDMTYVSKKKLVKHNKVTV